MEKKSLEISNSIIKLIPLLTVYVIFTSACKLVAFYGYFDINIFNYIELGEVSVNFLNDVIQYLFVFATGLFALFINEIETFLMFSFDNKEKKNQHNYSAQKSIDLVFNVVIILFGIGMLTSIVNDLWMCLLFMFFLIISVTRFFVKQKNASTQIPKIVLFLFIVPMYMWNYGRINALQLSNSNCVNIYDIKSLKLNEDSELFLGSLKNYTFYYNPIEEEASVYSNAMIYKQEIKKDCIK